jgi:hypothetical protein
MKRVLAMSLCVAFAWTAACGKKKAQDNPPPTAEAAKADQDGDATPAETDNTPAANGKKLTELYPPAIGVYPLSAPDPGRSLFLGFSSDGTQPFQMIWVYAVAAVPDFSQNLQSPDFQSEAEFTAFMEKWAAEFKENAEMVGALNKLATDFSFKVDPAFFAQWSAAVCEDHPEILRSSFHHQGRGFHCDHCSG